MFVYNTTAEIALEKHDDVLHDIVETILFSMAQFDDDIYKIHCYNILGVLIAHHASSLSDSTLWDIINQLFKSLIKYKLLIHFNNSSNNGYNTASSSNNMDSHHIMYNAAENLLQQVLDHSLIDKLFIQLISSRRSSNQCFVHQIMFHV